MTRRKCGCVYATAQNTETVRKGLEMGGYVKEFCAEHRPEARQGDPMTTNDRTEPGVCTTAHQSWSCPNMKPVEGDRDMEYEHYECKACGRTMKLDYEEMR